jgi:hypothetical protein
MHIMTHQTAQKVAQSRAQTRINRAAEIRASLRDSAATHREVEKVLADLPTDCDLLAWSTEGYAVALAAAVIGHTDGRRIRVHRASLLTPLALTSAPERNRAWTWVAVEELLGLGPPRHWALEWARARGGREHRNLVALVQ